MNGANLREKLAHVADHWSPKTVAMVNDHDVRVAKVLGEFVRHTHAESDEFFMVVDGQLTIRMDAGDVVLNPGEVFVVPKGTPHQPYAATETSIMLIEPREIVNTGDAGGALTARREEI
jgi:mannose-6-phosphate isomerase-like protein (cupin superfamily)